MIKKIFSLLCIVTYSLQAQVGIETDKPTETLHVNGTTRVIELPLNGADNAITTKPNGVKSNAKDQSFNPIKTVVADRNGVLGVVDGIPAQAGAAPQSKSWRGQPKGGAGQDFSDATDVESGCLMFRMDPTNIANISGVYMYAKLNPKCGTETYVIAQARRSSNYISENGNPYTRKNINSNSWTELNSLQILTQNSPIETINIAMPYLNHVYQAVVSANNGTDPSDNDTGTNWPDISIFLDELY